MKHLLATIILALCVVQPAFSFTKKYKKENRDILIADYYYGHLEFHKAIPLYEKAVDTFKNPTTYAKLGDCYRFTFDLPRAEAAYEKAVNQPGCADQVKLHYAQVLMEDTQYVKAAKWLKEYQKTNLGDKRVANMIAGCASAAAAWNSIPSGVMSFPDFNTDGSEFGPTLWKGKLVFTADTVINLKKKTDNLSGNAYYNMYSVACDANGKCGNEFSEVSRSKDVNIKYHDGPCTFSADGKQMYFTRSSYSSKFLRKTSVANDSDVVLLDIMIATDYDSAKQQFKEVTPFQYNSEAYSVAHPTVSPDGKMMVFSSNMPGGTGGTDLYLCKNAGNGTWAAPVNLGCTINTEGEEVFPYWADNTTLYFSSDGHEGLGGLDIYKTRYDAKSNTFSAPENLGIPINSSYDDMSMALYADGRSSFLSSNRPASRAGDNIWYYRRQKVYVQVNVTDAENGQALANAHLSLSSEKESLNTDADSQGGYFKQLYPQTSYTIKVTDTGYLPGSVSFSSSRSDKEVDTIVENIALNKKVLPPKDKNIYLSLNVIDSMTRQPLTGVNVILEGKKDYRNLHVDDNGHLFTKLMPEEQYFIQCLKIEYKTNYASINTLNAKKEVDTIAETVALYKIQSDTLELGVIPFAFGKHNINDTAKERLDVLVDYLNKNPNMRIELLGHTDCRGSDKTNDNLSKQRVKEVVSYLTRKKIAAKRLASAGLGARAPKIKCTNCQYLNQPGNCTELDHFQNRSLDFKVLSK